MHYISLEVEIHFSLPEHRQSHIHSGVVFGKDLRIIMDFRLNINSVIWLKKRQAVLSCIN